MIMVLVSFTSPVPERVLHFPSSGCRIITLYLLRLSHRQLCEMRKKAARKPFLFLERANESAFPVQQIGMVVGSTSEQFREINPRESHCLPGCQASSEVSSNIRDVFLSCQMVPFWFLQTMILKLTFFIRTVERVFEKNPFSKIYTIQCHFSFRIVQDEWEKTRSWVCALYDLIKHLGALETEIIEDMEKKYDTNGHFFSILQQESLDCFHTICVLILWICYF